MYKLIHILHIVYMQYMYKLIHILHIVYMQYVVIE